MSAKRRLRTIPLRSGFRALYHLAGEPWPKNPEEKEMRKTILAAVILGLCLSLGFGVEKARDDSDRSGP